MKKKLFGVVTVLSLFAIALAVACGSADSAFSDGSSSSDAGGRTDAGSSNFPPAADGGVAPIPVDAIVLVHAGQFPPFRLCFEGSLNEQPTPSADLMPSSNVVGLDVGSALLLPAKKGKLGKTFLFEESKLRAFYPPGKTGPSCETLIGGAGSPDKGRLVADIQDDLSSGVHLVVLTGCRGLPEDIAATPERCGKDWLPNVGNLSLRVIKVQAYARMGKSRLPVQALLLSTAVEGAASNRAIGIGFGDVGDGGADDGGMSTPFVDRLALFAASPTIPYQVPYDPEDTAAYASRGFAMSFGGPVDAGSDAGDAGARLTVLTQSLADVQRLSEPDAVPDEWYAVGASYLLLVVGDPDPRLADGGADPDPRHSLHLLAMPLSAPDAGADASPP